MKITKLLFVIILVIFALSSCNKSADSALTKAIPANATYVMNINTKSLIEKSDYNVFENVTVNRGFNMAKGMLGKKEAVDLLDAFSKDANAFGLNLKGDCYFYTDYSLYGMVFGVNDAKKIKQALIDFAIAQEDDIAVEKDVYVYSPDRSVVFAWDNDKFLMLTNINRYRYNDNEKTDLVALAKKQMTQDEKESINSNPGFAEFVAGKKDISAFSSYASLNVLENFSGMDIPAEAKKELDELKGISSFGYITFEKGEVVADSKIYYDTPETEKKYKELCEQLSGELKGEQLMFVPENPLLMISTNLKGSGIYSYLEKLGLASLLEKEANRKEIGSSAKNIFAHFEGDVTFSLNRVDNVKQSYTYGNGEVYEYNSKEPIFAVFTDAKDGKATLDFIIKTIEKNESGLGEESDSEDKIIKIDENSYSKKNSGLVYYFGNINNKLYLTNDQSVADNIKRTGVKSKYASLTKGNMMIAAGNLDKLKPMLIEEVSEEKIQSLLIEGLNLLGDYSYATSKDLTGKGKVEITDKSKNSFAVVCQYFDKVMIALNDQVRF